jgi:hypothetical protein
MTRVLLAALLGTAALTTACGPRARSAEPERRAPVGGPPFAATLDVQVGPAVGLTFAVTNHAARKLEILFPSGQTHDFAVLDSTGREVWRWSEGRMFTQSLQNRILDSSASLSWRASWQSDGGRTLPPGRYTAVASLLSQNRPLEQRVAFEVR